MLFNVYRPEDDHSTFGQIRCEQYTYATFAIAIACPTMAAHNNGDAKNQSFVSEMTDDPMIKKLALKDPGPQNIATISAGKSRNEVIYSFNR